MVGAKKAVSLGLSKAQVEESRRIYGENRFGKSKKRSFLRQFIANMGDPVIRILLSALLLNVLFLFRSSDWYETVGIGISVFLATFISTMSEYGSEEAFEKLSEESEKLNVRAVRDGSVVEIPTTDIVVGDLLILSAGEKIPADCVITAGFIGVDQSSMTGENREVSKEPERRPDTSPGRRLDPSQSFSMLGGCVIISGECEAVVCSVGDATFLGGISQEVQMQTRESPLKIRLTALAGAISKLGYIAAVLVAVAYLFNSFFIDSGFHPALIEMKLFDMKYLFGQLFHAFTLGLTVIVVAVPEGLPMMIAVVLSANIKKMVKDNVLVRKPVGIEAAGSMNILFTDKTGTLTEGRLCVTEYILGDGSAFSLSSKGRKEPDDVTLCLALSGLLNTSSVISGGERGVCAVGGNMTDMAFAESTASFSHLAEKETVIRRIPFDSAKKYSAVTLGGKHGMTLVKGAPEVLMPYVRSFLRADGTTSDFNRVKFEKRMSALTAVGKRVVLICKGEGRADGGFLPALTLVAAAVLADRVRKEAKSSVAALRRAGIHVVMVTGDNAETAASIAEECGILGGNVDICMTSSEMAKLGDVRLRELLPRIGVIARALPSDKSRLVRVAQEAEKVVGMTGDGINDAPALRRADIGFAMGGGTQVAKEAGDIIILDGNLASIVRAVLYGRNIFKSIRKFIVLQLTMNLCAVGVSMIGPFIGYDAPVTVVQMLWINIIMDTLGGLAFAGEAALPSCLDEPPKKRSEKILNRYMVGEIITLGTFTLMLCLAFLKLPAITSLFRYDEDNLYLLTAFFALFIFSSVFCCFCARTDSLNIFCGIGKNKAFISIMISIAVIQIGFIYLGGSVLRTVPLSSSELGTTLLLALTVFPVDFIRKVFLRLIGSENRRY